MDTLHNCRCIDPNSIRFVVLLNRREYVNELCPFENVDVVNTLLQRIIDMYYSHLSWYWI